MRDCKNVNISSAPSTGLEYLWLSFAAARSSEFIYKPTSQPYVNALNSIAVVNCCTITDDSQNRFLTTKQSSAVA